MEKFKMKAQSLADIHVLVVDDMVTLRQTIVGLLRSVGFKNIQQAGDGQEALERLAVATEEGTPFDLVLSDINMPKLNGIEFVKKMKESTLFEKIPVVMISTENEAAVVMDAISAGAINYLIKPFTKDALTKKLREISKYL